MNKPKQLYLVRHADVHGNKNHAFIGKTDLSLSPSGKKEAEQLKSKLNSFEPYLCLHSPAIRVLETMDRADIGKRRMEKKSLREIDFGQWEGLDFEQIQKRNPKLVELWSKDYENFTFPGGESIKNFNKRVESFANELTRMDEEKCVIFSHGGVIRSLICYFLGLPFEKHLLFQISTASITEIELFGERGVLKKLNFKPSKDINV